VSIGNERKQLEAEDKRGSSVFGFSGFFDAVNTADGSTVPSVHVAFRTALHVMLMVCEFYKDGPGKAVLCYGNE